MAHIALVGKATPAQEAYAVLLTNRGHRVIAIATLKEAESAVDAGPDLLVIDSDLPDGGALELTSRIRRSLEPGQLPIIFLTGGAEDDYRRAYAAGATDCLDRGVPPPVFLAKVTHLLNRAAPARAPLPKVGELLFGRYELIGFLGQGSYGAVFDATDQVKNRRVALKVMVGGDPESRDRFVRETYTLAGVKTPHVAEILGFGHTSGLLYCAMECVDGVSVSEKVQRHGPCTERELLDFLRAMVQALAALERSGFVHRDIKPTNVVLRDGRYDSPVLVDFGLAKGAFDSGVTSPSMLMGTPGYIAPEILDGPANACSDVFSLGQVALFVAWGWEAFPREAGIHLVLAMEKQPTPVPDHLSERMQRILRQMTDPAPSRRLKSARELQAALKPVRGSRGR
ncbi:MAG: protein kinase [Planctomycetes bacterium]|nr:protein kinase [Planctomycetota bacterium]